LPKRVRKARSVSQFNQELGLQCNSSNDVEDYKGRKDLLHNNLPTRQLFISSDHFISLIVKMHHSTLVLGALAFLLDTTSAHGFVTGIKAGSTWTKGSDPVWYYQSSTSRTPTAGWDALNQDIGFVEPNSLGSTDINCHKSATAGKLYADVQAGQSIAISWNTWPSDSHKGPIINYIAPCNGT
jgi:hypothetical protein